MRIPVAGLVAVIEEVSPFWGEPFVPVPLLPVPVVCACALKLAVASRSAPSNNPLFIPITLGLDSTDINRSLVL